MQRNFQLTVLGSSSAVPTHERNQTSLLLDLGSQSVLFDAGEGVQKQLITYKLKAQKISHVFISHLHPDHFIGLIGLLCSWELLGRNRKLTIVAPNGLQEIINLQLQIAGITLGFVIDYLVPTPGLDMPVLDEFRFDVRSFSLSHRVACFGYLLSEKPGERHLAVDKGMLPSLPYEAYRLLKAGRDFQDIDGKIYSHLDLTTGPDPIRQFAFFTDTNVQLHLAPYLLDCDLLYHDATFMDNLKEKAHETGHSTAIQAALFAKEAGVKKLILGHFSSRYGNLEPLRSEAQGVFPETYLAIEGKSFNINTIHK